MESIRTIEDYDISKDDIPTFINEIAKKISSPRKKKFEKVYKSIFDYVAILYYFRFVEKLEISEIAEVLEVQVSPLHINLYNFGWHYSKDYEKNNIEFEKEKLKLKYILGKSKESAFGININEHPKLKESISSSNYTSSTYRKLGFNTSEEYIKTIYHLIYIECLTTTQLVILFNIPYHTIQLRIRTLGFNLDLKEAMKKKKTNNRQNYEETFRSGKMTRLNSRKKSLSDSTKNENYARELVDKLIYEYLDSNYYDIVVGVNNTGTLGRKEADIPIMIHDRVKNKLFKIVLEYNGKTYHDDDKDIEKVTLAGERGWTYLAIIEEANGGASNNLNIIKGQVREVCMEIRKIVVDSSD